MLTGVCTVSSARMNEEGWLSEEACRAGMSHAGVPARLMGLEKLKEGRGRAEESDAIDGDLLKDELKAGEGIGLANAILAEDSFRGLPRLLLVSSSCGTTDERALEERFLKSDGGGARPSSSKFSCFVRPGDPGERASCHCKSVRDRALERIGETGKGFSYWD